MSQRLHEDVAIVTGGGAGIGAAACERFAAEGARVVVLDRNGDDVRTVADRLADEYGTETLALEADVGDETAVERAMDRVAEAFGRVDVLVNNAGVRVDPGPVTDATEAQLERILRVNLKGVVYCSKHAIPLMTGDVDGVGSGNGADRNHGADRGREGGAIVNVASVGATVARPGWSLYDGTKGAVVAMTRDMARDHADEGVRVNALSPGYVVTDYHVGDRTGEDAEAFIERETTPHEGGPGILERAARPEEIAGSICYLASADASYVTGEHHLVDGGASMTGL